MPGLRLEKAGLRNFYGRQSPLTEPTPLPLKYGQHAAKTTAIQRIFWAFTEGIVTAVLLVGGGLGALQTGVITTGLPFALVILFVGFTLLRALKNDEQLN